MTRLSEDVWLDVALAVASKSRCVRSQAGAVVCDRNDRVISTGYNGPPAGYVKGAVGPCDMWCERAMDSVAGDASVGYANCPAVHAEANSLLFAARRDVEGGTMYVTRVPCFDCAKLISNSGLIRVVYITGDKADIPRPVDLSLNFMHDCGIALEGIVAQIIKPWRR